MENQLYRSGLVFLGGLVLGAVVMLGAARLFFPQADEVEIKSPEGKSVETHIKNRQISYARVLQRMFEDKFPHAGILSWLKEKNEVYHIDEIELTRRLSSLLSKAPKPEKEESSMYETFEAFKNDALACGKEYYPDSSLQPPKLEAAYKIYQNARKGTQLLDTDGNTIQFGVSIVGRLALKVKAPKKGGGEEYIWLPADQSFPSIDEIMQENLKTMGEDPGQTGSISKRGALY